MSNDRSRTPSVLRNNLSRRDLLGFAARGAASVVVSSSLVACAPDGIYNGLSAAARAALTLRTAQAASGYAGIISLGVKVG